MIHSLPNPKLRFMVAFIFIISLCMFFSMNFSWAGERKPDPHDTLKIRRVELLGVMLTKIKEDRFIIDGISYISNDQTKYHTEYNKQGLTDDTAVDDIEVPCLVDINYKTFSVHTERYPYDPQDRVLVDLTVKWTKQTGQGG
ncbi:MAG: hypothetical protein GY729_10370 [Desulfobacteraceae bacterium]|nr:hypothetical protein [Desulfobacteraceae bacterium]